MYYCIYGLCLPSQAFRPDSNSITLSLQESAILNCTSSVSIVHLYCCTSVLAVHLYIGTNQSVLNHFFLSSKYDSLLQQSCRLLFPLVLPENHLFWSRNTTCFTADSANSPQNCRRLTCFWLGISPRISGFTAFILQKCTRIPHHLLASKTDYYVGHYCALWSDL